MERGLDCYDPENRVIPKFGGAKTVKKLSKRDIVLILKWKLGRIKDSCATTVADDSMTEINQAVQNANKPGGQIAALNALEKVPGIGLATATAILTVCYPDKFSILDQRVLAMLNLFPSRLGKNKPAKYDSAHWTATDYMNEFLPRVKECTERWGCSLRDADRALWGLSVDKRVKAIIGNRRTNKV
jgi:hypothetical protein